MVSETRSVTAAAEWLATVAANLVEAERDGTWERVAPARHAVYWAWREYAEAVQAATRAQYPDP